MDMDKGIDIAFISPTATKKERENERDTRRAEILKNFV